MMWFLHNKVCNAYLGPLFCRCERVVFMWGAETLNCNSWASNIPRLSLFIYTSITEKPGPSSLRGGKAAQAFMAEHICGVLGATRAITQRPNGTVWNFGYQWSLTGWWEPVAHDHFQCELLSGTNVPQSCGGHKKKRRRDIWIDRKQILLLKKKTWMG